MDFTHLHIHSIYSLLDGIIRIEPLCNRIKELGMTSCALTDHGNLHGVVDFYKATKAQGINPLIGIEAYLTFDEDGIEKQSRNKDNYHTILIAKNNEGLKNLFSLVSNASINNFYYRPRINIKNLEQKSEGLYATSACLGGLVAKNGTFDEGNKTFTDPDNKALSLAKHMHDVFQGRYFLEIQENHGMWEQLAYNRWVLNTAKNEGLQTVITADAHYLRREDAATHSLVMAMQLEKTLEEYNAGSQMKYGDGFFVRSPQEMYDAAIKVGSEEAFWNTTEISKNCKIDIELGVNKMPFFDVTKEPDYQSFLTWKKDCGH